MTTITPLRALLAISLVLPLTSARCRDTAAPNKGLPTTRMTMGTKPFTLEVADDDVSRGTGLMRRDALAADRGMLFVFSNEKPQHFWMKNTRIPLDIVYLDAGGKVVSIHTMKPYDLTPVSSAAPAKYAIELNAGMATQIGIKPGDVLTVPTEWRDPRN